MREELVLRVGKGWLRAERRRGRNGAVSLEAPFYTTGDFANAMCTLLGQPVFAPLPDQIRVELEPPALQRRTLSDLPPVASNALKRLVAHQSRKFFRHYGTALITDACWVAGQEPGPRLVFAVACDEPLALAILDGARQVPVRVNAIAPAEGPPGRTRLTLLPREELERRRRDRRKALLRHGGRGLLLLLGLTIATAVKIARLTRLDAEEMAQLRAPVTTLREVRASMDSASQVVSAMAQAERDRTRIGALLRAVSATLPDSAFLTSLKLEESGAGELAGEAWSPRAVVEALSRDSRITSPKLVDSRQTANQNTGWRGFTVALGHRESP